MTGRVSSVESFATLDGNGIRYAVFLAGCNLRCACCHNADTWSGEGESFSPERLAAQILRCKPYFSRGGGVTFSGGEPLLQAAFVVETARLLKRERVDVALDTAGNVWNEDVEDLLELVDLVILDLKQPDEESYRAFCGGSLAKTLFFAREVAARKKRLWLRTVVIPGVNDTLEDMDAYAELARDLPCERYELLGFHTMGFAKFEQSGIPNPLAGTPAMDAAELAGLQAYLDEQRR